MLGILVTSLAPAAAAVPTDDQNMHDDVGFTDLDTSSSDSDVPAPDTTQSHAASDGIDAFDAVESADPADGATASSEEESVDDIGAQVYTFPGTNGPTCTHALTTTGSTDVTLFESRDVFTMIDDAEGAEAPGSKDPRCPLRGGVENATLDGTGWVLDYTSDHGVTSSNPTFHLGTYTHSNHIDDADEIVKKSRSEVTLSPGYSDT